MARIFQRRLKEGWITLARGKGSLVGQANVALAADSATLSDANIPPAEMFDCAGYDSIFVGVDIAGGTAPTMTIQLLWRDSEAADGSRWRSFSLGSRGGITALASPAAETSGALGTGSSFVEMRTRGHRYVFPRITAVSGTVAGTTGWQILAKPGDVRPYVNGGSR